MENTPRHHILSHYIQHTKADYRFLWMSFGLKMSQDVFQMRMDEITERLPGVIAIQDDICIYGKTQESYDKNLLELLTTAQKMD